MQDPDRLAQGAGEVNDTGVDTDNHIHEIAKCGRIGKIDKVIAKGAKIAAHLLEAAAADLRYEEGVYLVSGTDRRISLWEVARAMAATAHITCYCAKGGRHDAVRR